MLKWGFVPVEQILEVFRRHTRRKMLPLFRYAEEGFWSIVVGAAAEESVKTGIVVNIYELLKRNGITI